MSKKRLRLIVVLSRMSPPQKVYSLYGATVPFIPCRCVDSCNGSRFSGDALNKISQRQQLLNELAGVRRSGN